MKNSIETTVEMVQSTYLRLEENLKVVRKRLGRPLGLAEKVLFGHLDNPTKQELEPWKAILELRPDRVAMQDATAQMALLQFLCTGKKETFVPSTVHCDHLIRAYEGAGPDMETALSENSEVYNFLKTASAKCGIGFWGPGSGIIHQVVLENYAFPGMLIIGTDSHTPNGGGLGGICVGVGGADAVDVMAGFAWEVKQPKIVGVKLTGKLSGWSAPKDVICKLLGILTVKGGTNRVIEYFGPGAESISCTGKATIANMGAELGATTSIFPFDESMSRYLKATNRSEIAELAKKNQHLLTADEEVTQNPQKYYDQVVEIDLSTLQPQMVGPHSPDRLHAVGEVREAAVKEGWPTEISSALIGSCTNSSYEDLDRVASLAKQAKAKGLQVQVPLLITPGSDKVFQTIKRDGQMALLESLGAKVLANACGPCIGQWKRDGIEKGTTNTIVSSYNRNFPARNDGNPSTLSFIGSPETVFALALSGKLDFDFTKEPLVTPSGPVHLEAPPVSPDLPEKGFVDSKLGYQAPPEKRDDIKVTVAADSKRLQLLEPFSPWNGQDFKELPLLVKAKGKCTTDHISPAGPWLKFRGHLDNISDNMFTGAINAFTGEAGKTKNIVQKGQAEPIPKVARQYKQAGLRWFVVGDENYGEGSSREHAAMCPRFLGAAAVIVKSFARIHETNLKKQGVLPLTFENPADYEKVEEYDRLDLVDLSNLAPGKKVVGRLHHQGGRVDEISLLHSLTEDQIEWFKRGSSLNVIASKQ